MKTEKQQNLKFLNMNEINWKAYQEGYKKCKEVDNDNSKGSLNPYIKGTIKWMSWNRGWNAY